MVTPPEGADPEWVPESTDIPADIAKSAARQANGFMRAYARPPKGQAAQWEKKIAPYLTTAAAETLQIGPGQVPFSRVTGETTVVPAAGNDLLATTPTDTGDWTVKLVPADNDDSKYLVDEMPSQGGQRGS